MHVWLVCPISISQLISVYVLSFNAKACMAVFHTFLLCLTILSKEWCDGCASMELSGKHKAELAGVRVQRAPLGLQFFSVHHSFGGYKYFPLPHRPPRYLSARLVNPHPVTLELGTFSISPDAQLVNLSHSTSSLYVD